MDTAMAALIGLALSATCGFRVFVPLLAVCIATRAEKTEGETYVQLAENFSWLASDPAFVVFLVAAIFEIAGYYLPIIDNFLDTLATPAAVVAGTLITAAFLVDMEPWLQWVLGVVAGVVRPWLCRRPRLWPGRRPPSPPAGWAIRWWPRSRPATRFWDRCSRW